MAATDKISNILNTLNRKIDTIVFDAKVIAAKDLEGRHKERIFVKGNDTAGRLYGVPPIARQPRVGVYSGSWGEERQRRGRQVSKKDLVFTGELFRNVQTGLTDTGGVAYGFLQTLYRLRAQEQERQTGRDIFNVSKKEGDDTLKIEASEIINGLRKCLKRI